MVVDGRQKMVGALCLIYVYSLLHFSLVPVGFTGQYFSVLHGH